MKKLAAAALAAITITITAGVSAAPAGAHTCGDYPNQAAAQRAGDTRDPDHDGIYCESLPCPCATSAHHTSRPHVVARVSLGHSVLLGRVTRRHGCEVNGPLPDRRCTPGARYSKVTKTQVCRRGYAAAVRHVSLATKNRVYGIYGIRVHFNGKNGEVDHLVSLELGGTNSVYNLFPESAVGPLGSHQKDRLENRLHAEVCAGKLTLAKAQRAIARDWVGAYHARFH
jgi:hypothetical protein